MNGRNRIPMTSGKGIAYPINLSTKAMCQTCCENQKVKISKECAECVKFSNWKDVEG